VGIAAIASHWLPAIRVIDALFLFMGSALPVLLLIGGYHYRRASRDIS
jgi:hypothetical protein